MADRHRPVDPSRADVALDDISATEWRRLRSCGRRGGLLVALDDISATEWRNKQSDFNAAPFVVALDDISATEWRPAARGRRARNDPLHSMISVLPNGG